jgi:hypothetical protein
MIKGVFKDLKYFLLFYMMVILLFSILFLNLSLDLGDTYEGIGHAGYIITSIRASLGDFETEYYND